MYRACVLSAFWHMRQRHERWRLWIYIAWREQSVWWWGGCVVSSTTGSVVRFGSLFFNTVFVSSHMYPGTQRDPSNRRLYEHGICIRHCQDSNSQPVPSQVRAGSPRPQWWICVLYSECSWGGRLKWFGHLERKSGDDWVSACRNVF